MVALTSKISALMNHPGFLKYFKNTGWMFFGRIFGLGISFLVTIYVARYLGPSNYGLLSYALSFVGLFSIVANLGIDQILYRELVKTPERNNELLGTSFFIKLCGGAVAFILIIATSLILNPDPFTNIIIAVISLSFLFNPFGVISYFFQAKVLSKYPTLITLANVIILAALKLLVIFFNKGVFYFSLVFLLEYVFYAVLYVYIYKRFSLNILDWKVSRDLLGFFLRYSWPLALSGAFVSIYSRIDQVMIKGFLDTHAVGLYDAAVRLSEAWYFVPGIIVSSVFPAIINAKKTNDNVYYSRIFKLFILLMTISGGVALTVFLFSKIIVGILYGSEFVAASSVLQIYIWAGIGMALGILINNYLVAENLTKLLFISSLFSMIVNVTCNFILIPRYGISGAATATLISYLALPLPLLMYSRTRKELRSIRKHMTFKEFTKF